MTMMVSSSLVSRIMSRRSSLLLATSALAMVLLIVGLVARDFRLRLDNLEQANRDYRQLSESQRTRIHQLQSELSEERRARQSESDLCSKESSSMRTELGHLEEQGRELQQTLADLKETNEHMEEETRRVEEQLQRQIKAVIKERDGKRSQYDSLLSRQGALVERIDHLETELEGSEEQRRRLQTHIDEMERGVDNNYSENEALHVVLPASSSSSTSSKKSSSSSSSSSSSAPNTSSHQQPLLQPMAVRGARDPSSTSRAPRVLQHPQLIKTDFDELEAPLAQRLHDALPVVQPDVLHVQRLPPQQMGQPQQLLRRSRVLQRTGRAAHSDDLFLLTNDEQEDQHDLSDMEVYNRHWSSVADDEDEEDVQRQYYESGSSNGNKGSLQDLNYQPNHFKTFAEEKEEERRANLNSHLPHVQLL